MLLAFWLLGQIVWPPWSLAESVSEGAALKLKSLKIIGNQIISSKAIKSQLTISLPTIWPWKKLPTFTEGELEADLERVKALYRQQGF
ncbi:POTRA domain-containing protein [Desulfobacca acetoxidans]|uniref:POTRA domain-containing protein n=1 Tax=Desulfobacca acetoxidans TaxID=60893 RepID=UPI0002D5952A|nr:POTRA domain-containing protein [Desulfobacca acetoxidans]